mgnify:CR=1 FL=1
MLTVIDTRDPPRRLCSLKRTDFPGVGPRLARRVKLHGIITTEQFCTASAKALALVWGSKLLGEKWARLLAGDDVPEKPPVPAASELDELRTSSIRPGSAAAKVANAAPIAGGKP